MTAGAIGEVVGIGAAGAWQRDASYYTRAPWAGRRSLHGRPVVDGALTNPFAHATATALALVGAARGPAGRAGGAVPGQRDRGRRHLLPAPAHGAGHPDRGRRHPLRRAQHRALPGGARHAWPHRPGVPDGPRPAGDRRPGAHHGARRHGPAGQPRRPHPRPRRRAAGPAAATRAFMEVVEAVRLAPEPVEVPAEHRVLDTSGPYPRWVVPGDRRRGRARRRRSRAALRAGLPWTREAAVHRG